MKKYGARLVVLDIMPGMDGFAVCRKIREESNTPILIVSAKTEKEDKLNGLFFLVRMITLKSHMILTSCLQR